jgi:endo-1,4-beta-xylanase
MDSAAEQSATEGKFLNGEEGSRSLKDAAKGLGLYMGASLKEPNLEKDAYYAHVAPLDYDLTTPGNACKMTTIARAGIEEKVWNYSECTKFVEFAKKNKLAMRAHNLVWASVDSRNPAWVNAETNFTQLEDFMIEYVTKTVQTVGDYPFAWDAVNEAIDDDPHNFVKASPWKHIPDFGCKIFKAAKAAGGGKQKLFYNDYNIISGVGREQNKSARVYEYVKDLHDRDCGIGGVGFQGHVDVDFPADGYEGFRANIKQYAALGLDVHVTEMDVKCHLQKSDLPDNSTAPRTCEFPDWPESELQKQANVYDGLLRICLEEPACKSFETWGFTDKVSWLAQPEDGLPRTATYAAKPAYTKMYETLLNWPRNATAVIARNAENAHTGALE